MTFEMFTMIFRGRGFGKYNSPNNKGSISFDDSHGLLSPLKRTIGASVSIVSHRQFVLTNNH